MKSTRDLSRSPRPRAVYHLPCGAWATMAVLAVAGPACAADVTLTASDAFGTSSFEAGALWSDGAAPGAGNAYFVPAGLTFRTPADSPADHTFAGDSLTLTGATLVYKGLTNVNTITINNFTLDASTVNNASNSSTAFVLGGSLLVAGTGNSTIYSNNATITVAAPISGNSGKLILQTNNVTGRQVILTGANTYTGDIEVTGASGAVLNSTGKLAFALNGTTLAYNTVTGASPFEFSGAFAIDLAGAGTQIGDSYQLVNTGTLAENFTATFTVEGWTQTADTWTSPDGNYQFIPSTGILVRIETDSDLDGLPDTWEEEHFGNITAYTGEEDPDGDFCSNIAEYNADTDPELATSFPDIDLDDLPDGWEDFYFQSLAQGALDDPDGDYSTNEGEFAALTDPGTRASAPDGDSDEIGDDWEIHFFGSTAACDPEVDGDGDLFTHKQEYDSATLPGNQISSPDFDLPPDGLPDGWEVKYFRVGAEPLEEAILHTDGTIDSDSDGATDVVEYHAGTDPTENTSVAPVDTAAYWRFEEAAAGLVANPEVAGAVQDVTGKGNGLMTYRDYTAPTYTPGVPDGNVTNTGAMNSSSLFFTEVDGNRYTSDNIYTSGTAPINTAVFSALTVEASFRTTRTDRSQGIIGKSGNPSGMAAPYQAPFTLKLNASNLLVAGLVDGSSTVREVVGARAIAAGEWYSAAVTASSTTLSLWLKAPGDEDYVLEASLPISGAWFPTGFDRAWVIGQTEYDPAAAGGFGGYDSFTGDLDEIRISSRVLPKGKFLANVASDSGDPDSDGDGMDDTWEEQYFNGSLDEGATGDYDSDGSSNLVEFMLGLLPDDGSSRFAAAWSGSTITWPAAAGTTFTVQRSTTMVDEPSWGDVATVVATGTIGTWTDPAPPEGKAFYRVVLATP